MAIVGGGLTGLWTAIALRERDPVLRIVLVEAERSGIGPSGRNGGLLHGYWSSLPRLRTLVGADGALEVARAADGAISAVRALDEDVWLRESGMLKVSAAPAQDASVERAVAVARELGVPEQAVPLTPAEVQARCTSPVYRAGVLYRDGATVQPMRLVRALRRRALALGVSLHEGTPATGIDDGVVRTPRGSVHAPEIVVATNAWIAGWRPVSRRLAVFGSYVVLTEPVPELLAEVGWTGGEAIVDARMFLHYFHTTPDGRVLMGSGSGPIGRGGRIDARFYEDAPSIARAEQGLRRLLPALASAKVTHAWGGPIDVSADHMPFFGTVPGTRVHYGAGYSGNGVGPSWLGGQVLASLALSLDDRWSSLPLVRRRAATLPPEPLRVLGGGLVRGAILRCEEAEEAGRRGPLVARGVAALPSLLGLRLGTR